MWPVVLLGVYLFLTVLIISLFFRFWGNIIMFVYKIFSKIKNKFKGKSND